MSAPRNCDRLLEDILLREGSAYTDDPVDLGGPTKYGITQATLSAYRGRQVAAWEVAGLTRAEALEIYRGRYVRPFEFIPDDNLLDLVVDSGVNHGVGRAAKWLQAAAGVETDGAIGPKTRAAVLARAPQTLYAAVLATRARFYGRIITDNPSQARFAAGWMNRLAGFIFRPGIKLPA